MKRYYSLVQDGATADVDIYGDITSYPWSESDVSAYGLSKQLAELEGVETINVNINSYGGEVAEGLAIYNALKRHKARVVTRCDGFACSIASVIFAAGDERVMHDASLLMIHNAWTSVWGANAAELRKQADDLDTITQASRNAYMANVSITEEELSALMDAETWISPQDALDMGFATSVESFESAANVSQSARASVFAKIAAAQAEEPDDPDDETEEPEDPGEPDAQPDGPEGPEDPEEPDEKGDADDEDEKKAQRCASFVSMAFD